MANSWPQPAPAGNKYAVGHKGSKTKHVTQRIIAKLHETNRDTNREYVADLVDELFEQALPHKVYETNAKGETVEVMVRGDLTAIEMIMNRSDGKAAQPLTDGEGGALTVVFQSKDKAFL